MCPTTLPISLGLDWGFLKTEGASLGFLAPHCSSFERAVTLLLCKIELLMVCGEGKKGLGKRQRDCSSDAGIWLSSQVSLLAAFLEQVLACGLKSFHLKPPPGPVASSQPITPPLPHPTCSPPPLKPLQGTAGIGEGWECPFVLLFILLVSV